MISHSLDDFSGKYLFSVHLVSSTISILSSVIRNISVLSITNSSSAKNSTFTLHTSDFCFSKEGILFFTLEFEDKTSVDSYFFNVVFEAEVAYSLNYISTNAMSGGNKFNKFKIQKGASKKKKLLSKKFTLQSAPHCFSRSNRSFENSMYLLKHILFPKNANSTDLKEPVFSFLNKFRKDGSIPWIPFCNIFQFYLKLSPKTLPASERRSVSNTEFEMIKRNIIGERIKNINQNELNYCITRFFYPVFHLIESYKYLVYFWDCGLVTLLGKNQVEKILLDKINEVSDEEVLGIIRVYEKQNVQANDVLILSFVKKTPSECEYSVKHVCLDVDVEETGWNLIQLTIDKHETSRGGIRMLYCDGRWMLLGKKGNRREGELWRITNL